MHGRNELMAVHLRSGDTVRVKSAADNLATLDEHGRLNRLPFMPEMLRWCGETVRVSARADKTCDTIDFAGLRRMTGTVHLDDLRCDGSAHGGCQAGCLLFWKEEWLAPPTDEQISTEPPAEQVAALQETTHTTSPDGDRFVCQATELPGATTPLPWWATGQYVRDVRSGNIRPVRLTHGLLVFFFNKYQGLSKRVLPHRLRIRGGRWYPFIIGKLSSTPQETLDLQLGELVEVKSRREILATLDPAGRNRGLSFDAEMLPYCGRRFRVLRRVERIIDEKTGRMREMPRDCIILAGVTCQAIYHRFCPRAIYPYWREIWLRRVEN
jgi:hypothetical protein